jgi:hypothetical protein
MQNEPFSLIDLDRVGAFGHLASGYRSLREAHTSTDRSGVTWSWVEVGQTAIGFTWLGPGRVWDTDWVATHQAEHACALEEMRNANPLKHQAEFRRVISHVRLGGLSGRVLYGVHQAVLSQKSSLITLADVRIAEMVWGHTSSARPRHWRAVLRQILRGLTWLHVADLSDGGTPTFGSPSVLITHFGDLRGTRDDSCPGNCGARQGLRHHHFQIDIGLGFLGVLERFGQDPDGAGIRSYHFPVGIRRTSNAPTLRKSGKSGRLVSAFAPAFLGDPTRCRTLSTGSHRILQALVRETTRPTKLSKEVDARAELVSGNRVRSYSGRSSKVCKLLFAETTYVGFNGNGKRRTMGYRLLSTEWSWLSKAGYAVDAVPEFLDDLAELVAALELIVVGVGPSDTFSDLNQLRGIAQSATRQRGLSRIDVRVFTQADYVERWSRYFGFVDPVAASEEPGDLCIRAAMRLRNVSGRMLATAIDCDPSFLAKILKGTKRWPKKLLKKAKRHLVCDHTEQDMKNKQPSRARSPRTRGE